MPEGVIAEVRDGFATIEFTDPALKGPALNRLIASGAPIETLTREGPRRRYRVPEGNAQEAGLLDNVADLIYGDQGFAQALADAHEEQRGFEAPFPTSRNLYSGQTPAEEVNRGDHHVATVVANHGTATPVRLVRGPVEQPAAETGDSGPSLDWKRDELDDYARTVGVDPDPLPNKQAVLDAIREAQPGE